MKEFLQLTLRSSGPAFKRGRRRDIRASRAACPQRLEEPRMARDHESTLDKLVRRLRARDVAVRVHAAVVLSEMGPAAAEAVPWLLQALSDADAHVRRLAAWTLGYVGEGEPEVADALQGALRDDDEGVCRMAAAALALIGLAGGPALAG